ncbi:MAG: DHH family phosphoesterase [Candidatus Pacearchaeota archaeon]
MLTKEQIEEILIHLEKTNNPLFFFDDDLDGLCSFLLLSRFINKGKGVAIKSRPELNKSYIKKIEELNSDYVFILDKPLVSKDFINKVYEMNIPIVWIDHHDVNQNYDIEKEKIYYYNIAKGEKKSKEPVTYWCYKINKKREDLWIALAGCISDGYIPDFISDFKKDYKELLNYENIKNAFDILYKTEFGKIVRILNFALKDKTSNVVKMIKILQKIKSPYEILKEEKTNFMLERFNQVEKTFNKLLERTKKFIKKEKKIIYFQYSGNLSLSADLSNKLFYENPDKFIVVVYIKGSKANVSIRGENAKKITEEAIKKLENATGGGHEMATGATLNVENLKKFKDKIEELVNKYN